jgi:hypothetical protein
VPLVVPSPAPRGQSVTGYPPRSSAKRSEPGTERRTDGTEREPRPATARRIRPTGDYDLVATAGIGLGKPEERQDVTSLWHTDDDDPQQFLLRKGDLTSSLVPAARARLVMMRHRAVSPSALDNAARC